MDAVMLRREWPSAFTRTIRDDKGEVVRVLRFEPGVSVTLSPEDYAAVKEDIGKALTYPRITAEPPKPSESPMPEPPKRKQMKRN